MDVVDTRYGKLIASRFDKYLGKSLFEYGEFSEGEVELFRQMMPENAIVCDVGANIGAHTLAFAKMAKHVYAFEPVPMSFNALAGMVALNDLQNVTCVQAGLSDKEGVMTYPCLAMDCENNLGAAALEDFSGERAVPVYPLTTPCHFLKIDVEGMESKVLVGASDMIRDCEPIIYVEADRKDRFGELLDTIQSFGYHPYWHTPLLFNPHNIRGKTEDVFDGKGSLNLLCVARELPGQEEAVSWLY